MVEPDYSSYIIYIVDDNPLNAELIKEFLSSDGYESVTFHNGTDLLEAVKTSPPDLIILDVMLPDLNGFDICKQIKNNKETLLIPIIMLTSLDKMNFRVRGLNLGADDYLTKPCDKRELMPRVRTLLKAKKIHDSMEDVENVLLTLVNIVETRDPYTRGHSERVAMYTVKLSEKMGYNHSKQDLMYKGAILHDIGKVGIDLSYLQKEGKLTEEEYEEIKRHPMLGSNICEPLKSATVFLPLIKSHHEKLNGEGYPEGLVGDEISEEVRIVAITDVFDALTSDRPYRGALTSYEAFEIMDKESKKGWWDKEILEVFKHAVLNEEG